MVTCQSHNLKSVGSIPASGKTLDLLKDSKNLEIFLAQIG